MGADPATRLVRVVIIEDNPADLLVLTEVIKQCGFPFELHVATDGEMALSLLQSLETEDRCPSLILLDLNLPKRSGGEILVKVRSNLRYGGIPVVITTSSDSTVDIAAANEAGATAYFRKPTRLERYFDLRTVIQQILA